MPAGAIRHTRTAALAVLVCLSVADPARGIEPQSIESFVAGKEKWPEFARAELRLKVEGRFSILSRTLLRFEKCDLSFVPAPGSELPRLRPGSRTVEAVGRLDIDRSGRLRFLVEQLRERPSDLEQFRLRQAEIVRRGDEKAWYALGEWASRRAAFYEDEELRAEADSANLQGLRIERQALAADDIEGRLRLAEKARELKLSETVPLELLHEAWRLKWDELRKEPAPDHQALLDELSRDLPGSRKPARAGAAQLKEKYRELPLAAYAAADPQQRRVLHRLFYAEVALEMIRADAQPDGRNGDKIARRIEELLPERTALAEQYRDAELNWRLSRVGSATRSDMLALAGEFQRRSQPEKVAETKQSWLAAYTRRMRREGVTGLVRAAEEHVALAGDRDAAVKLLIEAHALAPESKDAPAALRRLGYVWKQGTWLPQDEAAAVPLSPIQQAIREGRVTRGMTAVQVRQTLGAPTFVTRVATAGQINDVWSFGELNSSRLAVHFLRSRHEPPSEAVVIRISQVSP